MCYSDAPRGVSPQPQAQTTMDLNNPASSWALFWTILRLAALGVLATEAIFLLRRSRKPADEATPAARFVWSATPALVLAGLAVWCLAALPSPRASAGAPLASASLNLHR
jgi:hypothetical protein